MVEMTVLNPKSGSLIFELKTVNLGKVKYFIPFDLEIKRSNKC